MLIVLDSTWAELFIKIKMSDSEHNMSEEEEAASESSSVEEAMVEEGAGEEGLVIQQ